jgi:hypothetical protein
LVAALDKKLPLFLQENQAMAYSPFLPLVLPPILLPTVLFCSCSCSCSCCTLAVGDQFPGQSEDRRRARRKTKDLHLGQLSSGATGNLLDLKAGKLLLELLELLGELSLVLGAQLVSLDSSLQYQM